MRVLLLILVLMPATVGAASAQEGQQPYDIVRRMRLVQDEIATRSGGDALRLREVSAATSNQLLAFPSSVWKEPRNVKAAALYVLSGGNPGVLRKILGLEVIPHDLEDLAKGAVAYGEGDDEDAAEYLSELKPRSLDPSLAGVVALVQAVLSARDDPKLAITRLEEARLLAPGTLIEEAALRRQALLSLGTSDLQSFENLALQYLRRFSGSIYAEQFRLQFAFEVARLPAINSPAGRQRLAGNLAFLPAPERLALFLAMAAEGTVTGKVDFVRFAAALAAELAQSGTVEQRRAKLYEAAMQVVTADYDKANSALTALDTSGFDGVDLQIYSAALEVAAAIRRPESVRYPVQKPADLPPPKALRIGEVAPKPPRLFAEPPTVTRAKAVLNAADQVLKEGTR